MAKEKVRRQSSPVGTMNLTTNDVVDIAQLVPVTEAEGPGKRFALWVQGCPLRCPQCCNPEMLPFDGGRRVPLVELADTILDANNRYEVEGITMLGGEPFAHAGALAKLAEWTQEQGLTVMVFSGYLIGELEQFPNPDAARLLANIDILVDGLYRHDMPERERRWIGSSNQQIHFLSERYQADDPCWNKPNTLEVRLVGKELTVNGFPAQSAVKLWKRPKRR